MRAATLTDSRSRMNPVIAGILDAFEQQSIGNFYAVNMIDPATCIDCGEIKCICNSCEDCGEIRCICLPEIEIEDGYDHEAAMEARYGAYIEGEYPGDSL